jgi:flagellar biosynthesis component FlhA
MLNVQCPCGYHFKTFESIDDAIAAVRCHVESFHKDFLPFGITKDEALTLLNEGKKEIKPKISERTPYIVQAESLQSLLDRLLGEDIEVERRAERKKASTDSLIMCAP